MVSEKLLRHVVLLQFKEEASDEQISKIGQAFLALPSQIEVIRHLEWGQAINEDMAYSHCLTVTCHNEADLEIYGNHPAHQAIPATFGHLVAGVTVVDYWTHE